MLVFPFIFGHPRWLYLLLFVAFIVAGFLFNRFLRHSLRHGPRWGKSSVPRLQRTRSYPSVSSSSSCAPPSRPSAGVTPPGSPGVTPRPVPGVSSRPSPSARSDSPRPAPVSRFAYCRRYPDLLALCAGDVLRADRLVDVESKGSASAAPDVWVNLAISRLSSTR